MNRRYTYVGPKDLLRLLEHPPERACIRSRDNVLAWVESTQQDLCADGTLTATFVVDTDGQLWIADRHSEHVACAAGQDVFSAGEITFAIHGKNVEVTEVTNPCMGYCPEPESWWAADQALCRIGIPYPGEFTAAFLFRLCTACGSKNIVKDGCFECGVCGAELSREWNLRKRDQSHGIPRPQQGGNRKMAILSCHTGGERACAAGVMLVGRLSDPLSVKGTAKGAESASEIVPQLVRAVIPLWWEPIATIFLAHTHFKVRLHAVPLALSPLVFSVPE
jgi:hypothetical protein